jgi:hypothetical protein
VGEWYRCTVTANEIPAGVRASMRIVAARHALFGAREIRVDEKDIARVVGVFESNSADWVLIGAHAVGSLTEPRATADFAFIVDSRKLGKVLRDLADLFGELGQRDIGGAIELSALDIDLIQSANHALFAEALREPRIVGSWRVPRTEVLLALKFLASISPWRNRTKRALDVVDLRAIYLAVGNELDHDELVRLGGLAYPGAGAEFRELLDKVARGEPIAI